MEQIFIHTEGWKALHKYFVKEVLPKDYGGDEEKLKTLSGKHLYQYYNFFRSS